MTRWLPSFIVLEYCLAVLLVAGLSYDFWFFFENMYFPQPFFYDIGDTWMDWFNPADYAHRPGAYDTYKTIYPPLTYVILNLITQDSCYQNGGAGLARECDVLGIASLHLIYVLCIVLTAKVFLKIDRRTALPRSITVSVGLPMLWALDRGNVILITYIFVLLAYGPLLKSARLRWLFAGMAINMKIYLVGAVAAQLLHRRWRWAEGALIATVLVYLVTYAAFGAGSPLEIFENITSFAEGLVINNPLDIWMASSLLPLQELMRSEIFPTALYFGSDAVTAIAFVIPIIMRTAQAIIAFAAVACLVRPEAVPRYRMLTLSIGIAILSTEVSAYTQILVLLFCFMEPSKSGLQRAAIILGYVICIPLDFNVDRLPVIVKESFFFQRPILVEYVVQIGPFIRPVLTLGIPVLLSLRTIADVSSDIRQQGWATRWRFRRDAHPLPGIQRPLPPQAA